MNQDLLWSCFGFAMEIEIGDGPGPELDNIDY